jgi:membrane protein implicated in regulation of membrane protease activity
VTDLTSEQVVERCRTYWLGSGIDQGVVADMALELRSHLQEATAAGKSIESVTGGDIETFANEWAGASDAAPEVTPPTLPRTGANTASIGLALGSIAIILLVAAVALFAPDDIDMDTGTWATVWIVSAGLLAIGELLTAGFFLLPFAVGAGAAGILALAGVSVATQIVMFIVVSVGFLWLLQRFAIKDVRGELQPVGAARYIGSHAVVIEPVERLGNSGRVKMGTEDWRATIDSDERIPVGTEVRVVEVRGARLVVEQVKK